ncbi:MAG: hypothetical protein LBI17_01910 [Rickettsiales bacterium]|jgi:hypothetical protein|nr:hypothetical protein [Rickettsiales bacterium]
MKYKPTKLESRLMEGSTAEDLRLPKEPPAAPKTLSPEQVRRDISVLARALILGYALWPELDKHLRAETMLELEKLYNANGSIAAEDFHCALGKITIKLPDNHFRLWMGDNIIDRRRKDLKDVGRNRANETGWKVELDGNGVATIALARMGDIAEEEIEKFHAATLHAIDQSSAVIIDLRGNGGGDSRIATPIVHRLYGAHVSLWKNRLTRGTKEGAIVRNSVNIIMDRPQEEEGDGNEDPVKGYKDAVFPEFNGDNGYDKPVYMLLDGKVASSGEGFYMMLHRHPKLTAVGDNTAGMTRGGNVADVILPASGITACIAVDAPIFFDDAKAEEFVGFEPDIRVEDGQDAYEIALAHLANHGKIASVAFRNRRGRE